MSIEVFRREVRQPDRDCASRSNRAFHEDGERAVARAAKARQPFADAVHGASTSIEDAIAARGAPVLVPALYHATP